MRVVANVKAVMYGLPMFQIIGFPSPNKKSERFFIYSQVFIQDIFSYIWVLIFQILCCMLPVSKGRTCWMPVLPESNVQATRMLLPAWHGLSAGGD